MLFDLMFEQLLKHKLLVPNAFYKTLYQGSVKVILELSNKNSDHGSHIQEILLRKVSRLKLCVYCT